MFSASGPTCPPVSVVIATRGRPELLRSAVSAVLRQSYQGAIELWVVYDQVELDPLDDVAVPQRRALETISNFRTPGLAGGRNSGILSARHELVAFCDDDDEWLPTKLEQQMAVWARHPTAPLVATGISIMTGSRVVDRVPPEAVTLDDLLRSRITELHPSTFLLRREDLCGPLGLVDEELPSSYGEDYDLLLRAARLGTVVSASTPLVLVNWNRASFFTERWQGVADGLTYLLHKHPEFATDRVGSARIEGQIAFAHAALGNRVAARRWANVALGHDRRQLRPYAAHLVALGVLPATTVVRAVNRWGRGL